MADPHDVMDTGGRFRRGLLALGIGIGCAIVVYGFMYKLVRPESVTSASVTRYSGQAGAWNFVWYITGLAFIVPAVIVYGVLQNRERKKELAALDAKIPQAKVER
ncbi:MAG: hypothetical protein QM831_36785 [Kofleriaceae bacterium]